MLQLESIWDKIDNSIRNKKKKVEYISNNDQVRAKVELKDHIVAFERQEWVECQNKYNIMWKRDY